MNVNGKTVCKTDDTFNAKYWRPRPESNRGTRICSPDNLADNQLLASKTAQIASPQYQGLRPEKQNQYYVDRWCVVIGWRP